ncbi:MAG: carboxypeptidase regulatory-like domain-containing protein [Acidobacteriota bacterium]
MNCKKSLAWVGLLALFCAGFASAQTVNGVISGRVIDPGGLAIPNANVSLTREGTGEIRRSTTAEAGDFVFTAVPPGRYLITVEAQGMKRLEEKSVVLTASERLQLGSLQVQIGTLNDTVSVTAEATPVQTDTAERSAVLTNTQLESLNTRSRQFLDLVKVLPGSAYDEQTGLGSNDILGISQGPKISGLRGDMNTFQVDGMFINDNGTRDTLYDPINMDAVQEVKVLINNYQAEYGRSGGAMINAVTKNGTKDFHGGGYIYKRHEELNANSFFNNSNGVRKPLYRYTTVGGTLSGPVYWPGKLNRNREKLFFFYSNETLRGDAPQPLIQVTVPTALERIGNFSQSLDQNNKLIVIKDPTTSQPFADNLVPTSRVDANGAGILSIFPMPNQLNRAITKGAYNYNFQESILSQKQSNVFRIDLVATRSIRVYFRGSTWDESNQGARLGGCQPTPAWGFNPCNAQYNDKQGVLSFTQILSPTLVHEASMGIHHPLEKSPPREEKTVSLALRSTYGINLPQFHPELNPLGVVPWALFGGLPNTANIQTDARFPKRVANTNFTFNDAWTKVWGPHTLKVGFYGERLRIYQGSSNGYGQGTNFGQFDFSRDANNPLDTNYAYANAIVGVFDSYQESNARLPNQSRVATLEWYVQDNWKVTKKLALDYGIRISHYVPDWSADGLAWNFNPGQYDPAQAVTLYRPAKVNGQNVALNPLTGQTSSVANVGAIIPNSGNLTNGEVAEFGANNQVGKTFQAVAPVQYGPRIGIAYDPFGNGKTAIRLGGGILYESRFPPAALNRNPPSQATPAIFFGNLNNYFNGSALLYPSSFNAISQTGKVPTVYSYSLGVQRDVGFQTVVDVSYVGNMARHLQQQRDINLVPYGSRFLPQNVNPTTGKPLSDNYFRPYSGYTSINYIEQAGSSNYNAFQAQANHRFTHGLQFGVAWTWSKAMDYSDPDQRASGTSSASGIIVPTYAPRRIFSYGKAAFDHTHILVINWVYQLPKLSRLVDNRVVRFAFDNWEISNITALQSGSPYGINLATVDSADITGGGDGARVIMTCNPNLAYGDRTLTRFFNPTCFARPPVGTTGNAPKDVIRGPGVNNFDTSFSKDFAYKERFRFKFRWEMYNTFNHTQFYQADTTARFDATGAQTNARLGQAISDRGPRRMQGSLRLTF